MTAILQHGQADEAAGQDKDWFVPWPGPGPGGRPLRQRRFEPRPASKAFSKLTPHRATAAAALLPSQPLRNALTDVRPPDRLANR